ncbi:uncharacterized protein LOC144648854 [Oculina patagonica]
MPKSITTLQNQINGCEQGIQEALALCASEVGDADYKLNFSLAEVIPLDQPTEKNYFPFCGDKGGFICKVARRQTHKHFKRFGGRILCSRTSKFRITCTTSFALCNAYYILSQPLSNRLPSRSKVPFNESIINQSLRDGNANGLCNTGVELQDSEPKSAFDGLMEEYSQQDRASFIHSR